MGRSIRTDTMMWFFVSLLREMRWWRSCRHPWCTLAGHFVIYLTGAFLFSFSPRCIRENLLLISRAFLNSFIIPEWSEFCTSIDEIYWNCRATKEGKVANYIPQLARFRCSCRNKRSVNSWMNTIFFPLNFNLLSINFLIFLIGDFSRFK